MADNSSFLADYHCWLPLCFHSCFVYTDSVYSEGESEIFFGRLSLSKAGNNRQKKASFRDRKFKPIRMSISIVINDALV